MNNDDPSLKGQFALQKVEDMLTYADSIIPHWPALYRYSHGERIYNLLDEMEGLCVAANKKYFKKTTLQDLDIKNAQLKMLVRRVANTTYENKDGKARKLLRSESYEYWSGLTVETGKLIGKWMGSLAERAKDAKA